MARGLSTSLDDAEDLVQDVVTSVLPRWGELAPDPLPYLLESVYHRGLPASPRAIEHCGKLSTVTN